MQHFLPLCCPVNRQVKLGDVLLRMKKLTIAAPDKSLEAESSHSRDNFLFLFFLHYILDHKIIFSSSQFGIL